MTAANATSLTVVDSVINTDATSLITPTLTKATFQNVDWTNGTLPSPPNPDDDITELTFKDSPTLHRQLPTEFQNFSALEKLTLTNNQYTLPELNLVLGQVVSLIGLGMGTDNLEVYLNGLNDLTPTTLPVGWVLQNGALENLGRKIFIN